MEAMQNYGPWVLLLLGAGAVTAAILLTTKGKSALVAWIFGITLCGLGVYGPLFLKPWGEFVGVLNEYAQAAGDDSPGGKARMAEAEKRLLAFSANPKLTEKDRELALWCATRQPTAATLDRIRDAARVAPKSAKPTFLRVEKEFEAQVTAAAKVAAELQKNDRLTKVELAKFDPKTRVLIRDYAVKLSPTVLTRLKLDRRKLEALK